MAFSYDDKKDTVDELYRLNHLISDLKADVESGKIDEDVFADTVKSMIDGSQSNMESLANWFRKNEMRIDERTKIIKDLTAQKKHFKNINRQINILLTNKLLGLGVKSYTIGLNRIVQSPSQRVMVDDITKLPDEFFKNHPSPNLEEIKKAIKNGETIPGASLRTFFNINIK